MSDDALCFLGAAELGRRIARREVSPVEVTRAHLARIARLDAKLNAFLTVTADRALAEAAAAEREIAAGRSRGPLHGVPMALKDLFDTAGVRTTAGSKILAENVPARDAAVVERLRAAGLVLLGKTNLHEFAFGTTTNNPHYGPCRNPWDLERSPGGSSGGSGAALAAGLCAVSLGTDTGGSIRIPAGACGVVGLKPTLGRVSRRGVTPLAWSFDTVGPMARTVEDAALLLNAIAGPDAEDEWCAARPAEDFTRDLERGAGGLTLGRAARVVLRGRRARHRGGGARGRSPCWSARARAARTWRCRAWPRRTRRTTPSWRPRRPRSTARGCASGRDDYGSDVRRGLELGQLIPAVDYVNARRVQAIVRATFRAALERGRRAGHALPAAGAAARGRAHVARAGGGVEPAADAGERGGLPRASRCRAASTASGCRWACRSSGARSRRRCCCAWRGPTSGRRSGARGGRRSEIGAGSPRAGEGENAVRERRR